MKNINEKKNEIQNIALRSNYEFGGYSTLCMCTGAGKSRCGVLRAIEVVKGNPNAKIFLAVPTEKLRDITWKKEFEDWGASDIFKNNLTRSCYVSIHKYIGESWDLVIFDEFHHITENCLPFFTDNEIKSILGLTATPPKDKVKKHIIDTVAPISFVYPLQQGIKDGIVANFKVKIVYTSLDNVNKIIKAGSKSKPFFQTEKQSYDYWNNVFDLKSEDIKVIDEELKTYGYYPYYQKIHDLDEKNKISYIDTICKNNVELKKVIEELLKKRKVADVIKFRAMTKRKAIVYGSVNKERIAKEFIENHCHDNNRYLFFSSSITQSNRLMPNRNYNSKSGDVAYNKFMNEEINSLMAISALNEGENIPNLDEAMIIQMQATELIAIQRIGRVIRIRENHTGTIIVLCIAGTVDEVWTKKALADLKEISIEEFSEKEFFESISNV